MFTRDEIYSQPDAWHAALAVLAENLSAIHSFAPAKVEPVIFTGCGSTYYLALAAASLTQQMTGLSCRAFPASELWLYPQSSYVDGKTLLVAISRSGATTETLKACQAFLEGSSRGRSGWWLLLIGMLICVAGFVFGILSYLKLKNLPVHQSMRDVSELIYETCKAYLIQQGKFLLLLFAFIGSVIFVYFGFLNTTGGWGTRRSSCCCSRSSAWAAPTASPGTASG